jgi:hypothetical protein
MSGLQTFVHGLEVGRGRIFLRLGALAVAAGAILSFYDFSIYRGLNDAQSMDNAQLARQIARGEGFNTEFIRPYAIAQLNTHAALSGSGRLFHAQYFSNGVARVLPDTYNTPGYPCLLAAWFEIFRPSFDETAEALAGRAMYAGDRPIPWLNQLFLLLTAGLVFLLGRRLFDERVAWLAMLAFLLSDIAWQYSITALSTCWQMFLVTAMLVAALEIFSTGERREEEAGAPSWPAWLWVLALAVLLGVAGLTRLHLLVLLFPLGLFLLFSPRRHFLFVPIVVLITLAMVAPWFWRLDQVSGHLFGSNGPLLHYGIEPYAGDQVYRTFQPVPDQGLFSDATAKEALGFNWHLVHAWELLGSSPLILLFVASLLHHFRRRRAQALRFFLAGTALCLIAANNLGHPTPAAIDAWNLVIVLYPGMLVVGAAYFFVLIDRLELEAHLLDTALAVVLLALTAVPLAQNILKSNNSRFNYPPYAPAFLRYIGGVVKPETWITTDMPWAVAWYGDHAALWLPDKMKDFDTIYDEYCPSALLLLTPLTLDKPASNLLTGEDADWLPLVMNPTGPEDFPLNVRAKKINIDYIIWSSH